ncbi:MAG: ribosome biogenesis GTPase Der [Deltaproteobacteria bacterium]|nr:ribosome biogenesis GTPase Der [Deltaproteobacteria bacterium]
MKPFVALIGRTNVGKSTLFNRLTGESRALVDDRPGVTRDRLYGSVTWDDHSFLLIDTGGFGRAADDLSSQVWRQAELAAGEADLVLFMVDGRQDIQSDDLEVARFLRQSGKPVLLVINKMDSPKQEALLPEFYRFGLTPLYPISAQHGLGVASLLEAVCQQLPPKSDAPEPYPGTRVAVLGRPNVGKSSFINRVLGEDRLLVSDSPGTTRDAIDAPLTWKGRPYVLIDTAGIRRRSRVSENLERGMIWQALRAMQRAEVVVFLLDVQEGLTEQDLRILHLIAQAGKGCLIGLNKWDLMADDPKEQRMLLDRLKMNLELMPYAPLLPLSVATGYQVNKVFPLIDAISRQYEFRATTGELNRIFAAIVSAHPPPRFRHRSVRFYYVTQADSRPPTFIAFTNIPGAVPETYRRYLSKQLRERLGLPYAPIRLFFKGKERHQVRASTRKLKK